MSDRQNRLERRHKKHLRVRKRVAGHPDRPRLAVYRSANHIYAQLIVDGSASYTLIAVSTLDPQVREGLADGGNIAAARKVGEVLGQRAVAKGIQKVVFDRGGYLYHGRVAALAEGARASGLEF